MGCARTSASKKYVLVPASGSRKRSRRDSQACLSGPDRGATRRSDARSLRFEFLESPEPHAISETDLETLLCDHLQPFLLELGKGFTFVGRQYRITLNNT
ncbi:MAG: PDDEXK nuclease domain-containing protein, partial [Burkholderiales bacterium]